jgi:hypothetical protein
MKYILFKDGCGFAKYNPDDGSVSHTLNHGEATEAELSDWSDVLAFDFGDYQQILACSSLAKLKASGALSNAPHEPCGTDNVKKSGASTK